MITNIFFFLNFLHFRWKDIIENSRPVINKLQLRIDRNNARDVLQSNRKMRSVLMTEIFFTYDNISQRQSSIFIFVQDLHLIGVTIDEERFSVLINNCEILNNLVLSQCVIINMEREEIQTVRRTIERLVIIIDENCRRDYLKPFVRIILRSKFILLNMTTMYGRTHSLGEFLSIQRNLKGLGIKADVPDGWDIRNVIFNDLTLHNIRNIKILSFNFQCLNYNRTSHSYMDQLEKFLHEKKETLKVFQFKNSIVDFDIFKGLKLQKLIIDVSKFFLSNSIRPNRTLHNLVVQKSLDNQEWENLIETFPNIEVLSLRGRVITESILLKIKKTYVSIKSLNVGSIDLLFFRPLKF